MSGDFWDRSDALDNMFRLCEKWYAHVGPGCWPDCDMLPLGVLQLTEHDPAWRARKTRFTENEQRTVMNLWCIFRSPLMFGGEMTLNDEFTLSLLTNRDVLDIDRYSTGNRPVISEKDRAVWTCTDKNGNAVFASSTCCTPRRSWSLIWTPVRSRCGICGPEKRSAMTARG